MNELKHDPTPLDMLMMATEKGFDASQIEKLVNLHEQWSKARAREAYQLAMNRCQAEMPAIKTDGQNNQTKSRYAKLGPLIHAIKPVYTKHGFSLSFHQGESKRDGWVRVMCDVMHNSGHREIVFIDLPVDGIGAKGNATSMNAVQGVGSTMSYGERYLTCKVFNIPIADEDMDGATTLNDEQADMLEKLLAATLIDREAYLKWLGVKTIRDIPQSAFIKARNFLQSEWDIVRSWSEWLDADPNITEINERLPQVKTHPEARKVFDYLCARLKRHEIIFDEAKKVFRTPS